MNRRQRCKLESKKCYQDALKNKSEWSSVELPKSKIECQAFARNGGGVSMSIFADDGKDRETSHMRIWFSGPRLLNGLVRPRHIHSGAKTSAAEVAALAPA